MLDRYIETARTAREMFHADPSISHGMTWAYTIGRLVGKYKSLPGYISVENREAIDAELSAYLEYK